MKDIAIFGAGGFGREVLTIINDINKCCQTWNFIGFFDDGKKKGESVHGYQFCNSSISYPTIIHPSVLIGDNNSVEIGNGCIICASNIITTDSKIGSFVILNLACTVGHDTVIGDYSSFMPTCNISGEVNIGEGVYCGTGAKIINQKNVGKLSTIGAGAVVIKDVPDYAVVAGVPAKIIKYKQ